MQWMGQYFQWNSCQLFRAKNCCFIILWCSTGQQTFIHIIKIILLHLFDGNTKFAVEVYIYILTTRYSVWVGNGLIRVMPMQWQRLKIFALNFQIHPRMWNVVKLSKALIRPLMTNHKDKEKDEWWECGNYKSKHKQM